MNLLKSIWIENVYQPFFSNDFKVKAPLLARAVALTLMATFICSFPTWHSQREVPTAPLFEFLLQMPNSVHLALFAICFASCCVVVVKPSWYFAYWTIIVSWILSLSLDILRLQNFLYYYMLLFSILAVSFQRTNFSEGQKNLFKTVLVALYFWAGLHKFNKGFSFEVFPWIAGQVFGFLPDKALAGLGVAVPFLEMSIGLCFVTRRWRKPALIFATLMHTIVLICIGPFGLQIHKSVWPWNLFQIFILWTLFSSEGIELKPIFKPNSWFGGVVRVLVWVMPALSLFSLWPLFMSFHLYSNSLLTANLVAKAPFVEKQTPLLNRYWPNKDNSLVWALWSDNDNSNVFFSSVYYFKLVFLRLCERENEEARPTHLYLHREPIASFWIDHERYSFDCEQVKKDLPSWHARILANRK